MILKKFSSITYYIPYTWLTPTVSRIEQYYLNAEKWRNMVLRKMFPDNLNKTRIKE